MSSTPKKYRFHSVFLFFRRRSALTFLFRYSKFLLNFFKKLLTNYFSHSMISNVSGRQIQNNLHMREWLSWWSTTLPRSGPRVRVPSRALIKLYIDDVFQIRSTKTCASGSVGGARPCQGRGRGFESRLALL